MHQSPPANPASIKTPAQISLMRENSALLYRLFADLKPFMVAGSTGVRIQEFCLGFFRNWGFKVVLEGYRDFPAQVCISRNEVAAHGVPDLRPLEAGDLVTVDVAASRHGFCADSAWTFLIPGGGPQSEQLRRAAWLACLAGLRAGGESRRASAIGQAVQASAGARECRVLPRFAGHGIGRRLHEAPQVVFVAGQRASGLFEDGMVLNVEPVLCAAPLGSQAQATPEATVGADGWSWTLPPGWLCAQFEFSLALLPGREWQVLNFPGQAMAYLDAPPF
jgi:methionyl aminopeptidase